MKSSKEYLILFYTLFTVNCLNAQTYNSVDYAAIGDTVYLTKSNLSGYNFDTTGVGIVWDFSTLDGQSQNRIIFRKPTETEFSFVQWPYIFNTGNVNLSSTNGQTIALGGFQITNLNDYFKNSGSALEQKASSYTISLNGVNISVKNQFSAPDIMYRFPINFGNTDSSSATYITNIPGTFYEEVEIQRKNIVDGSGTVYTPYDTFYNALRLVSYIKKTDSIAILGIGLPKIITESREIKWFDESEKYPIVSVIQALVGDNYIAQSVEYLDRQQFFQPSAFFAYYPLSPTIGDTVLFQNLSTNATEYLWSFDDHSATDSVSNLINPTHIFNQAGIFEVKLIAINGTLSDTTIIPVKINSGLSPTASFTISDSVICVGDSIRITNTSEYGSAFLWDFEGGDPIVSFSTNPPVISYNTEGNYTIKLIVSNSNGADSILKSVMVMSIPEQPFRPKGDTLLCNNGGINTYTILNNPSSESYNWELHPNNSGNVLANDTSATIQWNSTYRGIAKLVVIAINGTCSSLPSDTLYIALNGVPSKAQKPVGETLINQNITISDYFTWKMDSTNAYQWVLIPDEAGYISGTDTLAKVEWTETFNGTARIFVFGINDCGSSLSSDTLYVERAVIDNINELERNCVEIFPNPAVEGFININTKETLENCTVEVYSSEGLFITSFKLVNNKKLIMNKGVKIIKIKVKNEVYTYKVVVL